MAISYLEATNILEQHALQQSLQIAQEGEVSLTGNVVGRISRDDYHSPKSTPTFDTSAMDGYAVNSGSTKDASPENPLTLCVGGIMAAADPPLKLDGLSITDVPFDACIRVEDTTPMYVSDNSGQLIQIHKPATLNENLRFAGNDFQIRDPIILAGSTLKPQHIMAFAVLGIGAVSVHRRLKIGVMSTGSELILNESVRETGRIHDCNKPYIMAILGELGVDVVDLGIVDDDCAKFKKCLSKEMLETPFDVIITTGAVSKGKFDFVRAGVQSIGAKVLFHKVAVRPRHPTLFASLPSRCRDRETVFFGLPGNPCAAAACLRFFVIPYLRKLYRQPPERPTIARLNTPRQDPRDMKNDFPSRMPVKPPSHLHVFWHGKFQAGPDGVLVQISSDQGSSKVKPLTGANCWISIPPGDYELAENEVVEVSPFY